MSENPDSGAPTPFGRNPVGSAIRARYTDGRWRTPAEIAAGVDAPLDAVQAALRNMVKRLSPNYKCEKQLVKGDLQYRIISSHNPVSRTELTEKLGPILKGLQAEARKNMATISLAKIGHLADELGRLVKVWS